MGKHYTRENDEYILANFGRMATADIAVVLGRSTDSITGRVQVLRKVHRLDPLNQAAAREIIRDGYDAVPWWCRQSTRCQYFAPNMYCGAENYDRRVNHKVLDNDRNM